MKLLESLLGRSSLVGRQNYTLIRIVVDLLRLSGHDELLIWVTLWRDRFGHFYLHLLATSRIEGKSWSPLICVATQWQTSDNCIGYRSLSLMIFQIIWRQLCCLRLLGRSWLFHVLWIFNSFISLSISCIRSGYLTTFEAQLLCIVCDTLMMMSRGGSWLPRPAHSSTLIVLILRTLIISFFTNCLWAGWTLHRQMTLILLHIHDLLPV